MRKKLFIVYNRHKYDNLIKQMLSAWETRLLDILNSKTEGV